MAVDIADCYAACWAEENHLLFSPTPIFRWFQFDLESKTQKVCETRTGKEEMRQRIESW